MSWPLVLANHYGAEILWVYTIFSGLTLTGCWYWLWNLQSTAHLPVPRLPKKPDPYKIAYLRGGKNEVTRLAIFALIDRGYLEIENVSNWFSSRKQIRQTPVVPDERHLSGLDRTVYSYFSSPRDAQEILRSLPDEVDRHCEKIREHYEKKRLLVSPHDETHRFQTGLVGGVILIVSWIIMMWAIMSPSNIFWPFMLGIASLGLLMVICSKPPRLTDPSKRYLDQIQDKYDWLGKNQSQSGPMLLLGMGIFGASFLLGTPHVEFRNMFSQATSSGGGGFGGGGGGCGGGGGGGGGCGGG